jgi:hypothetical protein
MTGLILNPHVGLDFDDFSGNPSIPIFPHQIVPNEGTGNRQRRTIEKCTGENRGHRKAS